MIQIGRFSFKKERLVLTLLAIPFIAFVVAFSYVPLFGWILAFINYKPGLKIWDCEYSGLYYFKLIFQDWYKMASVLKNTLVMSFLGLICTPLPAVFAIFLSELPSVRFKKVVQTLTTIPNFISWVIIYALAYALFSTEGVVNQVLLNAGIIEKAGNVLGNSDITWVFQTALNVWKGLGWNAIIYFAAIAGIDSELYDAASVDGAGRFQRILHITVPGISSTFFVLLLLQVSNLLALGIDQYLAFYNSMVADKILVLDLHVYRLGLITQDYSYATAVGIFKSLISILLLFSVNGLSKRLRGESLV
ncbi:MAG: sugar ABC transporter permease [Lachnospiraceae bacterium]|jgi:putative aldouronate transport system permease protein|nr:sugar ABC transporter permease [Lachnospiraceae bacterium]